MIGAGFGRTGTMSLKAALGELGFDPCYHMSEVFENPDHIETWDAAANGHPVNWEHFLGDYEATVDWPGCSFYKEMMQEHPDAKVLLSVRDPDRWYESASSAIYSVHRASTTSPFVVRGPGVEVQARPPGSQQRLRAPRSRPRRRRPARFRRW
ncbi:hypothetical protein BH24ACT22_BH24ACT22_14470 [soil metagenome]